MTYLLHVTLDTGHTRPSPRHEVRREVVRELTPILERALEGNHAPIWVPGYTIRGAKHGRCATVTLYGQAGESSRAQPAPVLTTGIAGHSRCGAMLWRTLHEGRAGLSTDPEDQPSTPWCADRLESGMALHPQVAEWTGDYSRCLAWAWLELRVGSHD